MQKYLLGLFTLVLVGAGCAGGVKIDALADATCDAYAVDETIASVEDRAAFRNFCYFEKAVATNDAAYCLSMEGFEAMDCVDYMASKVKDVTICSDYIAKSEAGDRDECITTYALQTGSPEACELLKDEVVRGFCTSDVASCEAGNFDESQCSLTPGAFLHCDALADSSLVKKCESMFPTI